MILKNVIFHKNSIFENKTITFSQYNGNQNYTTVIIGPNGTGKSCLLREICRIFKDTYGRQNGLAEKRVLEYKYEFSYRLNDNFYEVKEENGKRNYYLNNKNCNLNDWFFPSSVIAVSSIPNDKFIYSNNDDNTIYRYAGIRSSNSSSGTKTIIKNIINLFSQCDDSKLYPLKRILGELHFKNELVIYYQAKTKYLLQNFKNVESLDNYFLNWQDRTKRNTIPYNVNYYKNIDNVLKQKIIKFLKDKFNGSEIGFNIFNKQDFQDFKNNFDVLNILYKLDLLKIPEILFYKDNYYYNESDISSGEYNLIFQFIRILLLVNDNSLLLIDEPEISLHPNWQINYLHYLEKLLSNYNGIHTIVTTHSHLLLTNLNPDNSNVITISAEKEFENLEYSVSGWSPENILYRVFGVTAHRNYYFEMDLRKLITFIENEKSDFDDIKTIIDRLSKFKLSNDDPLKLIIDNAKKRM